MITAATLTYVALPSTQTGGVAFPTNFPGTVTGFISGENQGNATTGTLVFSTTATPASPPGSYAIDGSGLTANHDNYVFVQAAGNATALTLNGPPANILLASMKPPPPAGREPGELQICQPLSVSPPKAVPK